MRRAKRSAAPRSACCPRGGVRAGSAAPGGREGRPAPRGHAGSTPPPCSPSPPRGPAEGTAAVPQDGGAAEGTGAVPGLGQREGRAGQGQTEQGERKSRAGPRSRTPSARRAPWAPRSLPAPPGLPQGAARGLPPPAHLVAGASVSGHGGLKESRGAEPPRRLKNPVKSAPRRHRGQLPLPRQRPRPRPRSPQNGGAAPAGRLCAGAGGGAARGVLGSGPQGATAAGAAWRCAGGRWGVRWREAVSGPEGVWRHSPGPFPFPANAGARCGDTVAVWAAPRACSAVPRPMLWREPRC